MGGQVPPVAFGNEAKSRGEVSATWRIRKIPGIRSPQDIHFPQVPKPYWAWRAKVEVVFSG